jgi:very-short-patch-repair endonuclease
VINLMSERARRMRREKGPAERKLWYRLRQLNRLGFQFRQQSPIGPYIADFCDHTAKLIVEIDGAQHGEPKGLAADKRRTQWLESHSYRVLRFWNHEVLTNIYGVEVAIIQALGLLAENSTDELSNEQAASSAMERLRKKARRLVQPRRRVTERRSRQNKSGIVPSPLVGEGQGGGDRRTFAVGAPPTPNPSPQGGGESARHPSQAAENHNA